MTAWNLPNQLQIIIVLKAFAHCLSLAVLVAEGQPVGPRVIMNKAKDLFDDRVLDPVSLHILRAVVLSVDQGRL